MSSLIEIQNLTKYYGKTLAVKDLTLEVKPGEIFGFLGPNGAGKTTTIRTALGFLHPTSGGSKVLGTDSQSLRKEDRGRIGYLPGDSFLYGHLKGQEYLDMLLGFHENLMSCKRN